MNNMRRHVIKLVRNVIKEYASTEIPTFDEVCSGLGLEVVERSLPPGIDGMCKGNIVFINSEIQNEERKRFTRFHELTHYLIEKDGDLISELHEYTYSQEDGYKRPLEVLCNVGAAEFLMPSEEFKKLHEVRGFNVKLIPFAARYFKSSTIAATIQLAQVAPHKCITAICEYGIMHNDTSPLQDQLFNTEHCLPKPKLQVIYSASSPTTKYWLAKYTEIPEDHLINQAFLRDQSVEDDSYVPFRSGKKMPCRCEALADGDRIYTLFHLTSPPNFDQLTLV